MTKFPIHEFRLFLASSVNFVNAAIKWAADYPPSPPTHINFRFDEPEIDPERKESEATS